MNTTKQVPTTPSPDGNAPAGERTIAGPQTSLDPQREETSGLESPFFTVPHGVLGRVNHKRPPARAPCRQARPHELRALLESLRE